MLYSSDRKYDTSNQYSGSLVTAMPSRTYPVSLPDFIEVNMINQLPTQQRLKEMLKYNPETGVATYKVAPRFKPWLKGIEAGSKSKRDGYRRIIIGQRSYMAHRVVWKIHYGTDPEKYIDHINGIKDDNRINNLREATRGQNQLNRKVNQNHSTGVKGVYIVGSRYCAHIKNGDKLEYLGSYGTIKEASKAYTSKAKELHGEYYYGNN